MTNKAVGTIELRTKGSRELKNIVRQLDSVRRSTRGIARGIGNLRNLFFATFGAAGVREVVNAADSIQLLGDRINVFVGNTEDGAVALDDLFNAANNTNTSVESLAETFNRVALATKDLGINTDQLIGFTQTLQNTFRLSGASVAESAAASIQLSQGLASGQLRGQELRSVLEQNAVIGEILAKTFNTTRGNLIKFAESGKITADQVLNGLAQNAERVNEQAQKLGQTFGQTLTKAANEAKRAINEFNRSLELNERFADAVEFIIDNFRALSSILAGFGALGFLAVLPKIIAGFKALGLAIAGLLTVTNALIVGGVAGITFLFLTWETTGKRIERVIFQIALKFNEFLNDIDAGIVEISKSLGKFGKELFGDSAEQSIAKRNESIKKQKMEIAGLTKEIDDLVKKENNAISQIQAFAKSFFQLNIATGEAKINFKELNAAFSFGLITLSEYNDQIRKLEEAQLENRFEQGQITALQYSRELIKIRDINDGFTEKVFTSINFAAASYVQGIGSLTGQLADGFDRTFRALEDSIFDALKNGKLAFEDFTQFVLDELLKIAIRTQIIAPFAAAAGSFLPSPSAIQDAQASVAGFASGGVFSKGKQVQFASGGIVGSPTFFPMSSGLGLMGESGPEAVVPLARGTDGNLGIKANPANVIVNVNNEAGVEVDVQSNALGDDTVLDVTITRAVQSAINSGQLDRTMSSNFGLNRKGTR